jgi:replicative DNA helicase
MPAESIEAPADISLRSLPHNLDAERSVLGAILVENEALHKAQEMLREGDFYREGHRRIFRAMGQLSERSTNIDLVTLKNEMTKDGTLDSTGGTAYIASLVDGVPRSANVEYYARIVREKAVLRNLIVSSNRIISDCLADDGNAVDVLDSAERSIFQIAQDQLRPGFVPIRDIAQESLKAIEEMQERRELITGLPTGFARFNELTSGLQPADLIIVAGRPSMGKTTLALNIAQHVGVREKKQVGMFSLEMTQQQLFMRLLCGQARVDAHRLRTGRLGKDEWQKLSLAFGELSNAPIYIDDSPGLTVMEMRAKARRLKAEKGLDLLFIDYLQLMHAGGRRENRTQEISEISRSLKGLAKELNIPVVAMSQLSRAPEQRGRDHRPQLSDLRESGAIEQDADVVLFIFREEVYNRTEENEGRAQLIIGKQRNGPIGMIDLAFIKQYTKFEDLEWQRD